MVAGKARAAALAGILTVAVGFLTSAALSAPLDDALERIGRLEIERGTLLAEADSLGFVLASLPDQGSPEALALHRETGRLEGESREIELQILLLRERCRGMAQQELETLSNPTTPEEVARERQLLNLLDIVLADDWGEEYVLVEPDIVDGYETLVTKQIYLEELQEHLLDLAARATRRIEQTRRENALVQASAEFEEELRFLDESGQVNSDERILVRGRPGESPDGGSGRIQPAEADAGVENPGEILSMAPTPNGGDQDPLQRLATTRERIESELERVARALEATENLLEIFESSAR
jgi:hypothetical protein